MRLSLVAVIIASAVGAYGDWLEPENLGPTVNSAYNEWNPVVSRDGSYMIFVSDRPGGYGDYDLWVSYKVTGEWDYPVNMGSEVNTPYLEAAPYLAENDTKFYFASYAPGGYGDQDAYWCPINGDGIPGDKVNLGTPVNTDSRECCPITTETGNVLYFGTTRPGGYGQMDVWVSEKTGDAWGTPENLGGPVSIGSYECPRWVSDDGDTLIIGSNRSGGEGGMDLWYAVKTGDEWGEPVNFGPVVNSPGWEAGASFYDNGGEIGGILYFSSTRGGGYGGGDMWQCMDSEYAANVEPSSVGRLKMLFK
jgi:hypothetical protein